jgi:lipoyl-dependent peroxiredoxin
MARSAQARWEGTLKEGQGTSKTQSGAMDGQYSFSSRFEDGTGTNPEELIAAAHAQCYAMALNVALERDGHTPNYIEANVDVHMGRTDAGPTITKIVIHTEGDVPGIDADTFQQFAEAAKTNCTISRALAGVETMELNAKLV